MPSSILPLSDSAVLRAWRGEITLYRAAYGLGGIGLAVASLLGDAVLEAAPAARHVGWLLWVAVSAGELLVAWVATVATWRSAQRDRRSGCRYGPIALALALSFVGVQLALTVIWIGWTGLARVRLAPRPAALLLNWIVRHSPAIMGQ